MARPIRSDDGLVEVSGVEYGAERALQTESYAS
jgi:hypothetical protein